MAQIEKLAPLFTLWAHSFLICKMGTFIPTCDRDVPLLSQNIVRLCLPAPLAGRCGHMTEFWTKKQECGEWCLCLAKKKEQNILSRAVIPLSLPSLFYSLFPQPGPPGKPGAKTQNPHQPKSLWAERVTSQSWAPHSGIFLCKKLSHGHIRVYLL